MNWNYHVRQFIFRTMMALFTTGSKETRCALVKFSDTATVLFGLKPDSGILYTIILGMAIDEGERDTAAGFRQALFIMEGSRPGANKVVVLLTNGVPDNASDTMAMVNLTKAEGITVFVVGVVNQFGNTELVAIASDPAADHYFQVSFYSNLSDIESNVSIRLGQEFEKQATTATELKTTSKYYSHYRIHVLVIDSSISFVIFVLFCLFISLFFGSFLNPVIISLAVVLYKGVENNIILLDSSLSDL